MGQDDHLQGVQGVQGVDGVPTDGGNQIIPASCCSEGVCVDTPFIDYWVLEAACETMMNGVIKLYKTCADNPCG